MSRRSESLAKRIEEGAAGLAAFAEELSEEEWRTPVSLSDRRPVGVIVHHVAAVYPMEIQLAQAIARGKPVTGVTWEDIAELNARHAGEQFEVTKAGALELLRKNSSEGAAAVRAFTDDELDSAAPFSLSFGAPVTAQFVVEDHALRHSWHHFGTHSQNLGPLASAAGERSRIVSLIDSSTVAESQGFFEVLTSYFACVQIQNLFAGLRSSLVRFLLVSQGLHGFHSRCATRGQVCGQAGRHSH